MELLRAVASIAEPPSLEQAGLLRLLDIPGEPDDASYTDTFVFQLYPYASVYLGSEGMLGGEARDRVAGFFRALGVTPPAEPDHITVLLSAYAEIIDRETGAQGPDAVAWRLSRATLLWEHLLSWMPPYLARVVDVAAEPYRNWAELLMEMLRDQAEAIGLPAQLPLHLRDAPLLEDPRTSKTSAFVAGLLAPARTGMILMRDDLVRACRDLGLGRRIGERKFVLSAMLDQDPAGTLQWLAGHARGAYDNDRTWLGPVNEWWRRRATRTALLCDALADEVVRLRPATTKG